MITLRNVSVTGKSERGVPAPMLSGLSLACEPGLTVVLGAKADGAELLGDVAGGASVPRRGSALIAEAPAHHQRGHVARVGERPCLPEHATATEVLDLSWALRAAALGSTTSAPSAQARLERFGLGHLAARQVRALAHVDQRALALCEALTGAAPVLVLSEPLAHVAAAALPAIADGLRERVAASAVVLVTALADHGLPEAVQRFALSRGVLSPLSTAPVAESPGALRVVGADLRALTQALAGNPDVRQMHWADDEAQPGGHAVLTLHGTSRLALARAVQTAATSQGIALDRWEFR